MPGLISSAQKLSIVILLALLSRATTAQPAAPAPLKFDTTGAQKGEQLPNLPVYGLEGKPSHLSDLWTKRTGVLLLTSSLTCPKSRASYPRAEELAKQLGNDLPVEIIYVLEAHPKGDPSPYRGYEDVTPENRRDGILCPQPTTLEERLKLANRFKDHLHVKPPIHVDGMDNAVWAALGGGPNMGVLVDSNGIVIARQGWFDARSMQAAADEFVLAAKTQAGPKLRSAQDQEVDAQFNTAKMEPWQAARKFEESDPAAALDLLKRFPGLAQYTTENNRFTQGQTILALAAEGGSVPLIEAILSKGADVNAQNASSPSALHVAAKAGNLSAAELLIKHGANVNLKAPAGPTPLQEAAIYGRRPVVDLLLKAGAKPNFFFDVANGNVDAVRQSLQSDRSRAMRPDGWSRTPLDYAAATGQIEMLKLLQSFGASDEPGSVFEHDPALVWASQQRQLGAVEFLLRHGDDPNAVGTWGGTPLHIAALNIDANLAKAVLHYKPNLQAQDLSGQAPLHTAVEAQAYEVAALLLSGGANPNVGMGPDRRPCGLFGDETGTLETPLQLAAEAADLRMIRLLIGSGASINARDRAGWTALHHAVSAGEHDTDNQRIEAVEFLIAHGADVNARDAQDQSPLDVTNHQVLVPILKAHGAKPGRPE